MSTTTPILGLSIPTLSDAAHIENSLHPYFEGIETYGIGRWTSGQGRASGNPSPIAGSLSYITGNNTLESFDGTNWVETGWTGGWFTWNPTLITTGGGGIGNGTLLGRYRKTGAAVEVVVQLKLGSSTSFGTGDNIEFGNVPVAPRASDWQAGIAWVYDTSARQGYLAGALFASGNIRPLDCSGSFNGLDHNPFNWGPGDYTLVFMRYEVA